MSENNANLQAVWRRVREIGSLYLENLRLTSTEKATILISNAVVAMIMGVFLAAATLFISFGLMELVAQVLPKFWSLMIVGAFYILLALGIFMLRKPLIMNPIARFLSRLFLDPPVSLHPRSDREIERTEREKKEDEL